MALGARSADVLRLVVREGMSMAVSGVVLGLVGAFALTRLVGSLLFGVTSTDLPTFAVVTLGLLLIALQNLISKVGSLYGYTSSRASVFGAHANQEPRVHSRGGTCAHPGYWSEHRDFQRR
jgi:ABC-type antimicrobial peptide transport system permease subunit